jgi:hypothetical protein
MRANLTREGGRRAKPLADFPLPIETPPMEAIQVDALPRGPGWQYEPKWDGFRCLVSRRRGGAAREIGQAARALLPGDGGCGPRPSGADLRARRRARDPDRRNAVVRGAAGPAAPGGEPCREARACAPLDTRRVRLPGRRPGREPARPPLVRATRPPRAASRPIARQGAPVPRDARVRRGGALAGRRGRFNRRRHCQAARRAVRAGRAAHAEGEALAHR